MFRAVFTIPPGDEPHAARVFNLARQDVAGFDAYARKIAALFPPRDPVLKDLVEGLFHVAMADGSLHPAEEAFLQQVSGIFGLEEACFRAIKARVVPGERPDPVVEDDDGVGFIDGLTRGWEAFTAVVNAIVVATAALAPFLGIGLLVWLVVRLVRRRGSSAAQPSDG